METFIVLKKEINMFSIKIFWEIKEVQHIPYCSINKWYIHDDHNQKNQKNGPNQIFSIVLTQASSSIKALGMSIEVLESFFELCPQ
jgi:hypothetical protein